MRYENRQPREGINVSAEHPLREFLRLVLAVVALVVVLVVFFRMSGGWLAQKIPFELERQAIESLEISFSDPQEAPQMEAYLNELAGRLLPHLPLPDGMTVDVHYNSEDVFNAYATIGGNLLFYRGLLSRLPHENALAMVMAHEIAHVLHRDPVAGLGGGLASATALLLIAGNAGAAADLLNLAGGVTGLQFTRSMETEADKAAVAAVGKLYGHVQGTDTLFELIRAQRGEGEGPDRWQRFLLTHPLDSDRIARIAVQAEEEGWPTTGPLTPLPENFDRWLEP